MKAYVPSAVGVPEMLPAVLSVRPGGREPLERAQVMGVVPLASREAS